MKVCFWPRLCENAKVFDRDRTSHSFNTALDVHAASLFKFEIEFENIISSRFEFLSFHTV